ncbi:MAG: ACT domain-containing protein [Acidimicrobiia bacterium]|nr:ACT domain-containing protein [Acidimicrobiia bacterium]MDH5236594.1 ACT domain-containing protein [Acidimicrobiia bacterium]
MATDILVHVDDEPGALARVGHALGAAGVNIEGMCAVTNGGGAAEVHLLVDDPAPAYGALERLGVEVVLDREVAVVTVKDEPGVLGEVTERLSEAGVNLSLAYLATGTRLVLAADDLAAARAALT